MRRSSKIYEETTDIDMTIKSMDYKEQMYQFDKRTKFEYGRISKCVEDEQ